MDFDFDKINDRKNSNSLKWNVNDNVLPMWVADMDFQTAPCVIEAVEKIAKNGVFGYSYVTDEYYDAIINWRKKRYNQAIQKDWIIFTTGVIAAISSIVRRLTHPNENVLVLTPIYNTFFNSILNNGARALECKMNYKHKKYSINYQDLKEKLANPQTTLMILCNPHNPTGNIWSKQTLAKIGKMCKENNVTVISDEIHCDLLDPGYTFTPFASVNKTCKDISITCMSPSKSFNLAGLQGACVIIPNKKLFNLVNRGLNNDEVAEPNAFTINATIAAYNEGEQWLDSLRVYLATNKQIVYDYINNNLKELYVLKSHATYLLWIDISKLCDDSDKFAAFLMDKVGLFISSGNNYKGNGFIRMNIACPKSMVIDGLNRLKKGVELYKKEQIRK